MGNKALDVYKQATVQTAPPGELVLLLFNEAIKNVRSALVFINDNNLSAANTCFLKAQDIVDELRASLNLTAGGKIANNLLVVYQFIYDSLVNANIKKDAAHAEDALKVLVEIRDGWKNLLGKS